MNTQIWKAVPNFSNYEVSNLGNIRNNKTGKYINPSLNPNGYTYVGFSQDKRSWTTSTHRLVATVFHSSTYFDGAEVDHKNKNTTDNRAENLQWVTRKENVKTRQHPGKNINRLTIEEYNDLINTYSTGEYTIHKLTVLMNEKLQRKSSVIVYKAVLSGISYKKRWDALPSELKDKIISITQSNRKNHS